MCNNLRCQFSLEPIFSYCRFAQFFPCVLAIDHLSVMELGNPVPDVPLWEPSAAVTPVTAVSTNVVSQLAQSVVEVSHPNTLPVQS
jgi:hypothetical protein